ncbi:MAG TPA: ABC transporter permease [Thermoanaerobaculia bacterium]|nr:ABC transporter permease [Thermoanaerobaculia bacterium]
MNSKLAAVIKREYLQQIRTKAFWIATFLIPALGLGMIFIQVALSRTLVAKGRIAVVDLSNRLYEPLVAEYRARPSDEDEADDEGKKPEGSNESPAPKVDEKSVTEKMSGRQKPKVATKLDLFKVDATPETLPDVRRKLNKDVQAERIKAYIVLTPETLTSGRAEWRAQSVKAEVVMREQIANYLSRAVTKERLKDRGVDPKVYDAARLRVDLEPHEAKEVESGESGKNVGMNLAISATFFFLIYISIFVYGAYIMRGVLEEKNNRIVEVIVSSVRPTTLMLGKILGIGLVGLTQYAVWAALAISITLPAVAAAVGMGQGLPHIPAATIGAFVLFFVLGYFLYASLYAALSAPFNTEQEAQQFVMIPGMMLILTSTTWFFAFNQPNGGLATVLSFFPFTAPLMMFMRISVQTPPLWQIATSVALLCLTIVGVAWFAGRIYRVGILMYGKKPTLPEIFRWARQAD